MQRTGTVYQPEIGGDWPQKTPVRGTGNGRTCQHFDIILFFRMHKI
jgi:hypothetical protein